jgi:hypothetical protein
MSGRLFDPDARMREVRAVANLLAPATAATLLHDRQDRSNVATVANGHVIEIEERAGLAAGRVPRAYLDAWARLNQSEARARV